MKKNLITKRAQAFICLLSAALLLAGCASYPPPEAMSASPSDPAIRVYLFGEAHGEKAIMDAELAAWQNFYHNAEMRHLFIENSYSAAAFLNQWMHEDNDVILLQLYDDWEGTSAHTEAALDFYRAIKATCPETIFHGTDVGHQYASNGERYLKQLEAQGLKDSEAYSITKENNNQAIKFYSDNNWDVREKYMTENFIRELDSLPADTKVMGIYGSAHVCDGKAYAGNGPSMIRQLEKHYGNIFYAEDISWIKSEMEPLAVEECTINGKTYTASYFGEQDLVSLGLEGFKNRRFWRLENAYADFSVLSKTGNYLPQQNYPVNLQSGDVWMIEYTMSDDTQFMNYMVCFGDTYGNAYNTWEVVVE